MPDIFESSPIFQNNPIASASSPLTKEENKNYFSSWYITDNIFMQLQIRIHYIDCLAKI